MKKALYILIACAFLGLQACGEDEHSLLIEADVPEPGDITDPEQPGPGDITDPDQPDPGDITDPEQPGPGDITDPEQPDNPENPEQPDNPENPEQPDNPENPEQPDNPDPPQPPEPLVGCADPANEGKSCDNGETRPCAVSICRSLNCVSVPVTDKRVCRKSAGACDVAEACDGASLDCPTDQFAAASTVCRKSAGVCDVPENCTGYSADCPGDQFAPSSQVCRKSAGVCDVEEKCTGKSADCPKDSFQPKSHVCRESSGGCDIAEKCDGSSAKCPSDAFNSSCKCPNGSGKNGVVTKISSPSYVLKDKNQWDKYTQIIDSLGLKQISPHELNYNREMTSIGKKNWIGYKKGWFWNSGDCNVSYWIPQGLAGGGSGGMTIRVVGWHYDEEKVKSDDNPAADESDKDKGVRLSFIDTTDTSGTLKYRHVLLVEPDSDRGFKPVKNHVGGLVWYWPYLYVADTSKGMRVFDLRKILVVNGSDCARYCGKRNGRYCAYDYSYVLPQVSAYFYPSDMDASCKPKFSFIGLENVNGKKSILSGEYMKDENNGRLVRWPAADGGKLQTNSQNVVQASHAWYAGSPNLQGGLTYTNGKTYFLLNSTKNSGTLYVGVEGASTKSYTAPNGKWAYMPEGMYLTSSDNIWVSTEGHSALKRGTFYASVKTILNL